MIDTHAHLDFEKFNEDREDVIQRFFQQGGKAIINIGVDLERGRKSIEIANGHEKIFASVGLHPDFFSEQRSVNNERQKLFHNLKKLAKRKKVVAIGECGLDYYQRSVNSDQGTINTKSKELQKKGFLAQIEIARELNLPMIVHCREAWDDLYEIIAQSYNAKLKTENIKFVMHCFSGNQSDTEKFLKLPSVWFSFSGNITYPKPAERADKLAEAVRMIPLDKIMLDSDSPFLAPQEFRGERNEPIFIKYIAKKIAEIKKISISEVEKITDENAEKFFLIV